MSGRTATGLIPFEEDAPAAPKGSTGLIPMEESPTAQGVYFNWISGFNRTLIEAPTAGAEAYWSSLGLLDEGEEFSKWRKWMALDIKPGNPEERIAFQSGREAAINLGALYPMLRAASLRQVALNNPTVLEAVRQQVLTSIRNNPAITAIMEEASAASAGAGAQLAQEQRKGPLATALYGIGFGAAPGVLYEYAVRSPTAMVIRGVRRVMDKEAFERAFRREMAEEIVKGLDEQGKTNLEAATEVFDRLGIPATIGADKTPTALTIAEASNARNIIIRQQNIEASATGATLNALWRRRFAVQTALLEANAHKPEMTGMEPEIILSAAEQRVTLMRRAVQNALSDAEGRRVEGDTVFPLSADRRLAGRQIRDWIGEAYRERIELFQQRADDIGLNDQSRGFDFEEFLHLVRNRYINEKNKLASDVKPELIQRLGRGKRFWHYEQDEEIAALNAERGLTGEQMVGGEWKVNQGMMRVTFQDLQALRMEMNDQIMAASLGAGGQFSRTNMRQLIELRKIFDDWMLRANPDGSSEQLATEWKKFRADYFEQVIKAFDQGPVFKVRERARHDTYRVYDEHVASTFLENETSVAAYLSLFGNKPEALVALRSSVLDKLRLSAGVIDEKTGLINSTRLLATLKKARWLDAIPGLKNELMQVGQAEQQISRRIANLRQRTAVIEKAEFTRLLGLQRGDIAGMNPLQQVEKAIANPRLAAALVRLAKRNDLMGPLRAMVWDVAYKQLDTQPGSLINPSKFIGFLKANSRSLKIMLGVDEQGNQHFQHLVDIADGLVMSNRAGGLPKGALESVGPLEKFEETSGTGISQISSRIFAVASERTGWKYTTLDGLLRFINKAAKARQEEMFLEMMYDPNLARDAVQAAKHKHLPKEIERRLNGWMVTLGMYEAIPREDFDKPPEIWYGDEP